MNKQEIYDFLKNKNIGYEITEHKPVYNMQDLNDIELPYKDVDGKNLFVRDDKKRNYYLITLKGNKKIDLKIFSKNYHIRRLSFASEDDLTNILNLKPGSVTPLGLLNDKDLKVTFYLDEDFFNGESIVGIHPNDNTATIWLKVLDLVSIIKEHGNQVIIIKIN